MPPKFRFIITNLFDGCLQGTNDGSVANLLAENEDFYVFDSETHEWLHADGSRMPIEDYQQDPEGDGSEGDEDDEDDVSTHGE